MRRERGGQLTSASVCGLEISENCAQAKETPATSLPRPLRCTQAQPSKYAEPQGGGRGRRNTARGTQEPQADANKHAAGVGSVQQPTHSSSHTAPRCSHSTARTPHTPHARTPLPAQAARQQPTHTVTRVKHGFRTRTLSHTRTLSSTPPPSKATPCVEPTFYPLQTHTHSQAHAKHAEQRAKTCAAAQDAARLAPPPRKHTQNSSPCPQALTPRPPPLHI